MDEMTHDKYIRFDWAIKRLLRQKANFGVLEGFLTVFLKEPITIVEILESEGNQLSEDDKFNRVDIKARNSKGEIILIEVQNTRELYYLERILYGVAKAITEHISLGDSYREVKKVYSISILYFDLGVGSDYLYHGQNTFVGVHTLDLLQIRTKEKQAIVSPSSFRNLPGIHPHPCQRVRQGGRYPAGGMDALPEIRHHLSQNEGARPGRGPRETEVLFDERQGTPRLRRAPECRHDSKRRVEHGENGRA